MPPTLVETLAGFAAGQDFDTLPAAVVAGCKCDILDSPGCAPGASGQPKARIAVDDALATMPGEVPVMAPLPTRPGQGARISAPACVPLHLYAGAPAA